MYQTARSQRNFTGKATTGKITRGQRVQIVDGKRIVHQVTTKQMRASEKGFKKVMGLHRYFLTMRGFIRKPTASQIKKAVKAMVTGPDATPERTKRIKDIMYSVR